MVEYEWRLAIVENRGDCKEVDFLRADRDGLRAGFHYIQPSFVLDQEEISISLDSMCTVLPFADFLGHAYIGNEVGIDFCEGLTKS